MKVTSIGQNLLSLEISERDLGIVTNSILNAVDMLGEEAFHARVGASRSETLAILNGIIAGLREAGLWHN